jgi:hypothetical protein
MFSVYFPEHTPDQIAAEASPVIFLAASIAIFFRPRVGYWFGVFAGLAALPYFVRSEIALGQWNSWLYLNCEPGASFEVSCSPPFTRLRLLAFVLIPMSLTCAGLRLVPARWTFRGSPFCQRLWPAFAVSFLGLAIWFVYSARPYRLPMFHVDVVADLRILHVEKRGLLFHEACVFELRNRRVWATRADRRWFQYRFEEQSGLGVASPVLYERARALTQAARDWNLHTPPPRALWAWNAEGWYVVTADKRFSFTGAQPPEEVKVLFQELESSAPAQGTRSIRDTCLGFCYDPQAALGLSSLAGRSWLLRAD